MEPLGENVLTRVSNSANDYKEQISNLNDQLSADRSIHSFILKFLNKTLSSQHESDDVGEVSVGKEKKKVENC